MKNTELKFVEVLPFSTVDVGSDESEISPSRKAKRLRVDLPRETRKCDASKRLYLIRYE